MRSGDSSHHARAANRGQGNDPVGVTISDFTAVPLTNGIFHVTLALPQASFHTIFNGVDQAYIQVEDVTHGVTYPRQKFVAAPYALKYGASTRKPVQAPL